MPDIYQFSEVELLAFFCVLIRMSAFVVSWPVFGVALVPVTVKVLFSLVLAFVIFPVMNWQSMPLTTSLQSAEIVWLVIREAFIGLSLGYLARLFFYAVNICGEIVSISMGIASAQLFNPSMEERASSTNQFLVALAALFFLAINGHHLFLSGIVDSYQLIPLSSRLLSLAAFENFGVLAQEVMVIGVKMCSPVLVSILFMNLSMAVIGRAVPQINVLITSLPVNILVGFLVMLISLPLVMWQMHDLLEATATRVFQVLKSY